MMNRRSNDGAQSPLQELSDGICEKTCNTRKVSTTHTPPRCKTNANFPTRLHFVLSELRKDGLDHIACWQPHGRSFIVNNPKLFEKEILPRYFQQNKFSSFQRQLSFYGFRRINGGIDKGGYYHDNFLRGNLNLSYGIERQLVQRGKPHNVEKKPRSCSFSEKTADPTFYDMPFLPEEHSKDSEIEKCKIKGDKLEGIKIEAMMDPCLSSPMDASVQRRTLPSSSLGAATPASGFEHTHILSYNAILTRQNMIMEALLKSPMSLPDGTTFCGLSSNSHPVHLFANRLSQARNLHPFVQTNICLPQAPDSTSWLDELKLSNRILSHNLLTQMDQKQNALTFERKLE